MSAVGLAMQTPGRQSGINIFIMNGGGLKKMKYMEPYYFLREDIALNLDIKPFPLCIPRALMAFK